MNTQTHILLATALFARPGKPLRNSAAICGALVPDLSIYLMWAGAKLSGVPEQTIWRDLYWQPEWQHIGMVTNSVPIYFALALAAVGFGAKLAVPANNELTAPVSSAQARVVAIRTSLLVFALSALVHVATDFPVHVDDARPNFWPFSTWVFRSPVSYWDPDHHGIAASVVELILAYGLIIVLWRRFSDVWVRALLLVSGLSFAGVGLYWFSAFG